jgi:hypothetical protein
MQYKIWKYYWCVIAGTIHFICHTYNLFICFLQKVKSRSCESQWGMCVATTEY